MCSSSDRKEDTELSDSLDPLLQPQPLVEGAECLQGFDNPGGYLSTVAVVLGHCVTDVLECGHRLNWVFRQAEQNGLGL